MPTLYTTGCSQCNVLKAKLDEKGIKYDIVEDVNKMLELGMRAAPILEVDGERLTFGNAIKWVNNQ